MKRILVVGEDALSVALGERLVAAGLPGWEMPSPAIPTGGVTKLVKALPRSIEQSRHVQPVLCVADTNGRCAVTLLGEWLPRTVPGHFMLRLAVSEAESWILADRSALAAYFEISAERIRHVPKNCRIPSENCWIWHDARVSVRFGRKSFRRSTRANRVPATTCICAISFQGTGMPGAPPSTRRALHGHWCVSRPFSVDRPCPCGPSLVGRWTAGRGVAILCRSAPVAQLDRALPSGGKGQRFESSRARQPLHCSSSAQRRRQWPRLATDSQA